VQIFSITFPASPARGIAITPFHGVVNVPAKGRAWRLRFILFGRDIAWCYEKPAPSLPTIQAFTSDPSG